MRYALATALLLILAPLAMAEVKPESTVEDVLGALRDAGKDLKSLAAKVELSQEDADIGDANTREGNMVLERKADGDTRIRATFTKYTIGKRTEQQRREYLLSGPNLVERDYKDKKQTTRVVRGPNEKLDMFKLGEGPFPLPIGQPPEQVQKEFDVARVTPDEPNKDLVYVQLTPKPKTPLAEKFKQITVGVRPDGWPVEVRTTDKNETKITTAKLTDIRLNANVNPKEFDLEPIDETWTKVDVAQRN